MKKFNSDDQIKSLFPMSSLLFLFTMSFEPFYSEMTKVRTLPMTHFRKTWARLGLKNFPGFLQSWSLIFEVVIGECLMSWSTVLDNPSAICGLIQLNLNFEKKISAETW